jgi:hypothetical protein
MDSIHLLNCVESDMPRRNDYGLIYIDGSHHEWGAINKVKRGFLRDIRDNGMELWTVYIY